jgi:hypothetical protein
MKSNGTGLIVILLIMLIVLVFWLRFCQNEPRRNNPGQHYQTPEIILKVDTITKVDTLIIQKTKVVPKVKTDTIFVVNDTEQVKGFRACYDTNFAGGGLEVCFNYPVSTFDVSLRVPKDTILVKQTIFQILDQTKEGKWYEKGWEGWIWGGAGLVTGVLIGVAVAK